MHREN